MCGAPDDNDAVVSEELPGRIEKRRAVVHDQGGERENGRRAVMHQEGSPPRLLRARRRTAVLWPDSSVCTTTASRYMRRGRLRMPLGQRRHRGMPEPERVPRVVIADDEALLRQGLAALLREGGTTSSAGERRRRPDRARTEGAAGSCDRRHPHASTTHRGLEAARTIREELPQIAISSCRAHRGRACDGSARAPAAASAMS